MAGQGRYAEVAERTGPTQRTVPTQLTASRTQSPVTTHNSFYSNAEPITSWHPELKPTHDMIKVGSLNILPVDEMGSADFISSELSVDKDCWYDFRLYDVDTIMRDGKLSELTNEVIPSTLNDTYFAVYEVIYRKEKMKIALKPQDMPLGDLMTRTCDSSRVVCNLYEVPFFMRNHIYFNECKAMIM